MGWVQKFKELFVSKKAAPSFGGGRFVIQNGVVVYVQNTGIEYIEEGYQANDIVYAAIGLITDQMKKAPWAIYKVEDESSLKQLKAIERKGFSDGREYAKYMDLRKKSLTLIERPNSKQGKVADLLKWANEDQTFEELIEAMGIYMHITGNSYTYANMLDAGANAGLPQELFVLPSQYTNIIAQRGFPPRVVGYQLNSGEINTFTRDEVLHTKYFNPSFDYNGSHLVGQSPLQAARTLLTTSNEATKAAAASFVNGGASTLIFLDDERAGNASQMRDQLNAIKAQWAKEYAGSDNWNKKAFSGYKAGAVKVGDSVREMALMEMNEQHLRRLFNIWGIPSQLGNDPANKTYNNEKEAGKALITRCALPMLKKYREGFNRSLQNYWGFKGENVVVDYDITVYPELQINAKEVQEAYTPLFDRGLLTGNELRSLVNMEETTEPMHDKYFITGNYMPIEEMGQNNVDQALNDPKNPDNQNVNQ